MNIIPRNYNLIFEPNLEKFTFKGKEILTFEVKEKIKEIILDAVDLEIKKCWLIRLSFPRKRATVPSGKSRPTWIPDQVRNDKKEDKLIINLSKELQQGKYQLHIEFEGMLNDKLAGFYRSRFLVNGKEKVFATSQFETVDARRAFPCIDHPSYKATFAV